MTTSAQHAEDQLVGLDPATYAPYDDPRDDITSWTVKIRITRGLGHLRDHYAPDVKIHTAKGRDLRFRPRGAQLNPAHVRLAQSRGRA